MTAPARRPELQPVTRACLATMLVMLSSFPDFARAAIEPPDTSHCGPQVVVLHAKSREPVARAHVYVRQRGEGMSTSSYDRSMEVDDRGRVDFAALPVGDYEVAVTGISRRRPLADWKPPPGEREIAVGFDPWRRPDQIQRFTIHRDWRVTWGNCWDSLVVLVRPTRWELQKGREQIRRGGLFPKRLGTRERAHADHDSTAGMQRDE